MNKKWKYISGIPSHYRVYMDGSFFAEKRTVSQSFHGRPSEIEVKERIIKPYIGNNGYYTVSFSVNGKTKSILAHRALAIAFIPNPQGKHQVNHIDGNKLNNSLSNLEWATGAENIQHAYNVGLRARGEGVKGSKLTQKKVLIIKKLLISKKYSMKRIGKAFGVSGTIISLIKSKKKWKHVK